MRRKLIGLGAAVLCTVLLGISVYAYNSGIEYENDLLETEEHVVYISGYNDGTFKPDGEIIRAEAAVMLHGLLKAEVPQSENKFVDVADTAWYARSVNALAELNVISGRDSTHYEPNDSITRAEFVSLMAKFVVANTEDTSFPDVTESHWAYEAICTVGAYDLISGYEDGTFKPNQSISRAEAVLIINKLLGRIGDSNAANYSSTKRFSDVPETHWAFMAISEAATEHTYTWNDDGTEKWDVPENDIYTWESTDLGWKFLNVTKNTYVTGFKYVDGLVYYFDETTELLQTGWTEIDGLHYLLPTKDEDVGLSDMNQLLTVVNYEDAQRTWKDINYITVHYTAVPDDNAQDWCTHFYSMYRASSAHYFVDESSVWQSVLDEDISWHSGTSASYYHAAARNSNSIGIEMCCRKADTSNTSNPLDSDWYFLSTTEYNTAQLTRALMKTYAVPIENVIRHWDITHKICPAPYVNVYSQWQNFLSLVTENAISYKGDYAVTITENDVKVYSGPGTSYSVVDTMQSGDTATVYEEKTMGSYASDRWARIGTSEWVQFAYIMRQ